MVSDKNYDPYCKVCGSCGEDGCCSAVNCEFTDECRYKEIYLKDLKHGYLLYQRLYKYLDQSNDSKEIEKIEEETYNQIYGN